MGHRNILGGGRWDTGVGLRLLWLLHLALLLTMLLPKQIVTDLQFGSRDRQIDSSSCSLQLPTVTLWLAVEQLATRHVIGHRGLLLKLIPSACYQLFFFSPTGFCCLEYRLNQFLHRFRYLSSFPISIVDQ